MEAHTEAHKDTQREATHIVWRCYCPNVPYRMVALSSDECALTYLLRTTV